MKNGRDEIGEGVCQGDPETVTAGRDRRDRGLQAPALRPGDIHTGQSSEQRGMQCMAGLVRRVCLLFKSSRSSATICLILVITVGFIKLFVLLPIFLVVKNHSLIFGSDHNTITDGKNVIYNAKDGPSFSWRPDRAKLRQLLAYLNLTEEEARQNLPLTLESKFLMNNASVCGAGHDDPVDLLFMVHTAPVNFHRRLQMRNTIFAKWRFKPFQIRTVFLLGAVSNSSLQEALAFEHALYQDTVQGDFLDTYQNLSLKGVLGFRWISQYCARARHVIKMDDDVFFDTYKILFRYRGFLEGHPRRSILCNVWVRNTMPIAREGDSKWLVDKRHFQGAERFPYHYCSGFAVVFSGDLVPSLYQAAFFSPVFWIDDIYLFGMLPALADNVTMLHLGYEDRYMVMDTGAAIRCMEEKLHRCPVLATMCYTREDWETMWNITYHLHVDTEWRVPYVNVV